MSSNSIKGNGSGVVQNPTASQNDDAALRAQLRDKLVPEFKGVLKTGEPSTHFYRDAADPRFVWLNNPNGESQPFANSTRLKAYLNNLPTHSVRALLSSTSAQSALPQQSIELPAPKPSLWEQAAKFGLKAFVAYKQITGGHTPAAPGPGSTSSVNAATSRALLANEPPAVPNNFHVLDTVAAPYLYHHEFPSAQLQDASIGSFDLAVRQTGRQTLVAASRARMNAQGGLVGIDLDFQKLDMLKRVMGGVLPHNGDVESVDLLKLPNGSAFLTYASESGIFGQSIGADGNTVGTASLIAGPGAQNPTFGESSLVYTQGSGASRQLVSLPYAVNNTAVAFDAAVKRSYPLPTPVGSREELRGTRVAGAMVIVNSEAGLQDKSRLYLATGSGLVEKTTLAAVSSDIVTTDAGYARIAIVANAATNPTSYDLVLQKLNANGDLAKPQDQTMVQQNVSPALRPAIVKTDSMFAIAYQERVSGHAMLAYLDRTTLQPQGIRENSVATATLASTLFGGAAVNQLELAVDGTRVAILGKRADGGIVLDKSGFNRPPVAQTINVPTQKIAAYATAFMDLLVTDPDSDPLGYEFLISSPNGGSVDPSQVVIDDSGFVTFTPVAGGATVDKPVRYDLQIRVSDGVDTVVLNRSYDVGPGKPSDQPPRPVVPSSTGPAAKSSSSSTASSRSSSSGPSSSSSSTANGVSSSTGASSTGKWTILSSSSTASSTSIPWSSTSTIWSSSSSSSSTGPKKNETFPGQPVNGDKSSTGPSAFDAGSGSSSNNTVITVVCVVGGALVLLALSWYAYKKWNARPSVIRGKAEKLKAKAVALEAKCRKSMANGRKALNASVLKLPAEANVSSGIGQAPPQTKKDAVDDVAQQMIANADHKLSNPGDALSVVSIPPGYRLTESGQSLAQDHYTLAAHQLAEAQTLRAQSAEHINDAEFKEQKEEQANLQARLANQAKKSKAKSASVQTHLAAQLKKAKARQSQVELSEVPRKVRTLSDFASDSAALSGGRRPSTVEEKDNEGEDSGVENNSRSTSQIVDDEEHNDNRRRTGTLPISAAAARSSQGTVGGRVGGVTIELLSSDEDAGSQSGLGQSSRQIIPPKSKPNSVAASVLEEQKYNDNILDSVQPDPNARGRVSPALNILDREDASTNAQKPESDNDDSFPNNKDSD